MLLCPRPRRYFYYYHCYLFKNAVCFYNDDVSRVHIVYYDRCQMCVQQQQQSFIPFALFLRPPPLPPAALVYHVAPSTLISILSKETLKKI